MPAPTLDVRNVLRMLQRATDALENGNSVSASIWTQQALEAIESHRGGSPVVVRVVPKDLPQWRGVHRGSHA